jgi:hypothetical protein
MKIINESKIIIIIFCLTIATSAHAAGFLFNWQPFFVDSDLALKHPTREALIKDLPVADLNMLTRDESRDMFSLTPDQNIYITPRAEKKFAGNIKIFLSPASTFMTSRDKMYTNSDDEQMSKLINAMSSLIYGNSKIKSLETMGKIIEPQVNFYFEF